MAAIKSYTDIPQSKVLANILPTESADMYYSHEFVNSAGDYYKINIASEGYFNDEEFLGSDIPAWSLATLLDVIPSGQVNRIANSDKWEASSWNDSDFEPTYYVEDYNNPIDACYELIIRLHEMNLL